MTAPTVAVTVDLSTLAGVAVAGVTVRARLDRNEVYDGIVISTPAEAVTNSAGVAVLHLFPNAPPPAGLGTQGSIYTFTAAVPRGRNLNVDALVPNVDCRLETILVQEEQKPPSLDAAQVALMQAQAAVTKAAASAAEAEASADSASVLLGRTLRTPEADALADLPSLAERTGKFLVFDASGNPVVSEGTGADAGLRPDLAALSGASLVGFTPPGGQPRSVAQELSAVTTVAGLTADDLANNTALVQAAIDAVSVGTVRIPPGAYAMGSITIASKAPGSGMGGQGGFKLDCAGVVFTGDGTGSIVIDGCKRIEIDSLDAPTHDLRWRGCWWSAFRNFRYQRLVIGDAAGSRFNSNYWNKIDTCQFQSIVVSPFATFTNALTFINSTMRGNANQGFLISRDYAIEFNANSNCQAWQFFGGDISYHNTAIYRVGDGNTDGDIEVDFHGVYFDSLYPAPISRARSRIATHHCHSANKQPVAARISAVARGPQMSIRQDRSAGWTGFSGINFIPNGDLRVSLPTYAGAGLPVGATAGAVVTEKSGGGPFGRYLNISQANLGAGGQVRFRPLALPFPGRYTGLMLIRNGVAGTRQMRLAFNSLFESISISDTEWTLFSLTSGADIAAGTQPDIIIRADDDVSTFNVDVCYAAVTFGEGGMPMTLASPSRELNAAVTWDPPNTAAGGNTSVVVAVPGAAFGDFAVASFGRTLQGGFLLANVTNANEVTVVMWNPTGASIDPLSSTLRVRVLKEAYV